MRQAIIILVSLLLTFPSLRAQTAGKAGGFSRMGFGARGMGLGNAMTSVINGEVTSYYNPAIPAFSTVRHAQATYTILSLDRSLNYLSYTQSIHPTGGLSIGLINAGVSDIDGRDRDGEHTEYYSTYENQVYLSFSNRIAEQFSIGVTMKLFHSKLLDQVTTTTVGFDAGALYRINDRMSVGVALQDIGSKYKWNTKDVYSDGKETENKFPMLRRLGFSYTTADGRGLVSIDLEHSPGGTVIIRSGIEYEADAHFSLRAGADRIDLGEDATGVKPTFGFTVRNSVGGWMPALSYAYTNESFAPRGYHMITLSAIF